MFMGIGESLTTVVYGGVAILFWLFAETDGYAVVRSVTNRFKDLPFAGVKSELVRFGTTHAV